MNNLFNKIESLKKSFTDSEKKILKYIKKNSEEVTSMSIKELSGKTDTGEATIR